MAFTIRLIMVILWLQCPLNMATTGLELNDTSLKSNFSYQNIRHNDQHNQHGLITMDYQLIPLGNYGHIDLMGLHYLHQIYSFAYVGPGLHFPLFYGNYGGFMTLDLTLHLHHQITHLFFINGSLSLGGGGGGSSVDQSRLLSGNQGHFYKQTIGVGIQFPSMLLAFNMSHFKFTQSLIDHTQFNIAIHKPISFSTRVPQNITPLNDPPDDMPPDIALGFDLMSMNQNEPTGTFDGNIHAIALQFSHYPALSNNYVYFEGDVGIYGLPAYNQALIGLGHRYSLTKQMDIKGQFGIGSGGYSPTEIDTGPGVFIYPKVVLDYFIQPQLSLSLSSGMLIPIQGAARLATFGIGLNLHRNAFSRSGIQRITPYYRLYEISIFNQHYANVTFQDSTGSIDHDDLSLLSLSLNYYMNRKWYIPIQLAMATRDVMSYPGYGEGLIGLGFQSSIDNHLLRPFAQVLIGANPFGLVIKPELGLRIPIQDSVSIYIQAGQLSPLNALDESNNLFSNLSLDATSFGIGITSQFSFLEGHR